MSEEKLTGSYNPMDNVEETLSEKSLKWWNVDEHGNISYNGHTKTVISSNDLANGNQLVQQMSKSRNEEEKEAYIHHAGLVLAYIEALRNAGYKKMTIDVTNIHAPIVAE